MNNNKPSFFKISNTNYEDSERISDTETKIGQVYDNMCCSKRG